MKTSELKKIIHALLDRVEDEELLEGLFRFLTENKSKEAGKHWDLLSQQQKNEVSAAYEESEDEGNLIAREEFYRLNPELVDLNRTKLELIGLLLQTRKENVLERIKSVFEEESGDWWDDLSDEEKKEIELGLQDVENGNVVDYEEVKKLFRN